MNVVILVRFNVYPGKCYTLDALMLTDVYILFVDKIIGSWIESEDF